MQKNKITTRLTRAMEVCLCGLVFFIPFSKAGVEVWLHLAIVLWLAKRFHLGRKKYRNTKKKKDFFGVFKVVPTPLNKAIFILAGICILSTLLSVHIGLAFEGLLGKWFSYFFIFFIQFS